jgi:ATP-binding cassette subfamily B protein RaxB
MAGRLRTVLQSETGECGLACLAAVNLAHGGESGLAELRTRSPASARGMTLQQLMELANGLGFNSRALRLETDEMEHLPFPSILHWDLCHFVVLVSTGKNRITVMDPAVGRYSLSKQSAAKHFTGIALELRPTSRLETGEPKARLNLFNLLRNTHGLGTAMAHSLAIACCLQVLALLGPVATQWMLDHALPNADRSLVHLVVAASALLGLLTLAFQAARGWLLANISAQVRLAWAGGLANHLFHLPVGFFGNRSLGGILSRFDSMRPLQELLTETTPEVVLDGLLALTTLMIMVAYAPGLALLCSITWLLYAGMRFAMFPVQLERNTQVLAHAARERSFLLETLRHIASWKQRAAMGQRCSMYLNHLSSETNAHTRLRLFGIRTSLIRQALATGERVMVLWLGANSVISGELTAGMLIAFLAYKMQFSTRIANLTDRFFELRSLTLHGERIADITAHSIEAPDLGIPDSGNGPFSLVLHNLSFRYSAGDSWLFQNLELQLEPGQWLALQAPSGAGKSTLMGILGGLLTPTDGQLLCNGRDIRNWREAYRRSLGAVMQRDGLMSGTLAENISFFCPEPDRARIEQVSQLVGLHEEIRSWPLGYFTRVGELAHALSGGQVQRLLLARALYHRPRLLLLDEAFSQLDANSVNRICAQLKRSGTSVVSAGHRKSSLDFADLVLSLEAGHPARIRMYHPR